METKKYVILLAGGLGKRTGLNIPKQFFKINGKEIIVYTIKQFTDIYANIEIIISCNIDYINHLELIIKKNFQDKNIKIIFGGNERFNSVKNALNFIPNDNSMVMIHDSVRPFVSKSTIQHLFENCELNKFAIPYIKSTNSLRIKLNNKYNYIDRDNVIQVVTPQTFNSSEIIDAYNSCEFLPNFTDDLSVYEHYYGTDVLVDNNFIESNPENFKITNKNDLLLAEKIIEIQDN